MNLQQAFGSTFKVTKSPEFSDPVESRLPDEYYDRIEGRYGFFFLYDDQAVALLVTSNKIKNRIVAECKGVKVFVEGDDEAVLHLPFKSVPQAAKIIRARKRRRLSPKRRQQFVEAGRKFRFTGQNVTSEPQNQRKEPTHTPARGKTNETTRIPQKARPAYR